MKYSIIVPTKNCSDYIKDCVQSVITQYYHDYELIISDNHSTEPLDSYVHSLQYHSVRFIKPQNQLAMVDHFEFALAHAQGEWIITLGADDGVQPYFFQLCEFLTTEAQKKNLKIINSPRAYFFWDGCSDVYGTSKVSYTAQKCLCTKNTTYQLFNALIGVKEYNDLPQMYTTSIVHVSVIENIKRIQNGVFFTSLTPDACGAATLCSLENCYLESKIPLSWVGTSPKSNGYQGSTTPNVLKENMLSKNIKWHTLVGVFNNQDSVQILDQFSGYFYESLLNAERVQSTFLKTLLRSKFFRILLFSNCYDKILKNPKTCDTQLTILKNILMANKISFKTIVITSATLSKFIRAIFKIGELFERVALFRIVKIQYTLDRTTPTGIRLYEASEHIVKINERERFLYHNTNPPIYVGTPRKIVYFCLNVFPCLLSRFFKNS